MTISSGIDTQKLNGDQKKWLAVAICGAIIADGNVATEELAYLEKALSFISSTETVKSLIHAVKEQKLPKLEPLTEVDRTTQTQILIEMALIASSDNSLSPREMEYLFNIGKKLGFESEFVQIVLLWANEGIIWRNRMQTLIKTGTELQPEYE